MMWTVPPVPPSHEPGVIKRDVNGYDNGAVRIQDGIRAARGTFFDPRRLRSFGNVTVIGVVFLGGQH